MQVTLWTGSALAVALGLFSAWAERRRARRANLDAVGFMPWPLIMVLSLMVGAICAALALRAPG